MEENICLVLFIAAMKIEQCKIEDILVFMDIFLFLCQIILTAKSEEFS